jgi:pentatricopeptide repeat domain-containing protein 1
MVTGEANAPPDAGLAGLRPLFAADQALLMRRGGGHGGRPAAAAPLGWGGAQLPQELSSARAPWFGRSKKAQQGGHRQRGGGGGGGGGGQRGGGGGAAAAAPGAAPGGAPAGGASSPGGGGGSPSAAAGGGAAGAGAPPAASPDALSVDDAVALVKRTPRGDPLPDRVLRALRHLDSRAAALLLKDLSKAGLERRAVELADWLRALPEGAPLRALCDVYTYTAMISLCLFQQNVERAMGLLEEMRARGVERNVHTFTALMNVCIKVRDVLLVGPVWWGGSGRGRGADASRERAPLCPGQRRQRGPRGAAGCRVERQ